MQKVMEKAVTVVDAAVRVIVGVLVFTPFAIALALIAALGAQ